MVVHLKTLFKVYMISFLIVPNYFALFIPGIPLLSMQRVIVVIILLLIIAKKNILNAFLNSIRTISIAESSAFISIMILMLCTGVINGMNNFFNPLFDWTVAFLLFRFMYTRYFSLNEILNIIKKIIKILCICGLIEFVFHFNIFTVLDTGVSGLNYGALMRGDSLRICTAFGHPLSYSLMLNMFFPLLCYNTEKKKINLLQNKGLFVLVCVNIILTGSRSGIAVFIAEAICMYLFTNRKYYSNLVFYSFVAVVLTGMVIMIASDTSFVQNVIRTLMYVIDELFGTEYAVNFGGVREVANSSKYREALWKIFDMENYQTLFGKGNSVVLNAIIDGFFVESIDNYYVNAYLRFGILGLLALIWLFLVYVVKLFTRIVKKENASLAILGLTILIGYIISLFVVDELGTMRYMMIVLSILSIFCIKGE